MPLVSPMMPVPHSGASTPRDVYTENRLETCVNTGAGRVVAGAWQRDHPGGRRDAGVATRSPMTSTAVG